MSHRLDPWPVPRALRQLPADLGAILAFVVATNLAVFLPVIRETSLRIVVGLPFVLFVPGYTVIVALFPEAGGSPREDTEPTDDNEAPDNTSDRGIDGIERVALSFGLSIAVVPLIGLVLNFTPWGIRLAPIMIATSGFTVISVAVAAQRRWELPPDERFRVPYREWYAAARSELFEPETRTDTVLNLLLIVSVLLAVGSVGYAVAVPKQGEQFTEFYLLTENETGALVADNYPTEFRSGEERALIVGIGNHEHEAVNYTVIAEIQRVDVVDNETRIRETRELRRFRPTVAHNETWRRNHTVAPELTGERLRLQYLLYRGPPPTPLNRSEAYREVHLWVNVTESVER